MIKKSANQAIEFLLARGSLPILFWLKKDVLEVPVERELKNLEKYGARIRILESQKPLGCWGRRPYDGQPRFEKTCTTIETLKNVSKLYDYGCTLMSDGIQKATRYLFSTQTKKGEFHGMDFNEYALVYHALTLETLCRFGLDKDVRVQKGFRWMMQKRQKDGGWSVPAPAVQKKNLKNQSPLQSKSYSHLVTGMVLRAFAESPTWKERKEAWKTGDLLLAHLFKENPSSNKVVPSFGEEIGYPFWNTDILSSLDSLSKIGFCGQEENIQRAIHWLIKRQNTHGFWETGNRKSTLEDHLWVTLAVLKVLKRFKLFEL
jgi:prenyltransferase beta subunit